MSNNLKSKKILSYDDVAQFPAGNDQEYLVDVTTYDTAILTQYLKEDMLEITGDIIFVRDSLAKRLAAVNKELQKLNLRLKVVYGYRHPDVQERYFIKRCAVIKEQFPDFDQEQLNRYTHNFVAVPDVAGHPAGGAVDLTIVDANGKDLDMGTAIADYTDPNKIITFVDGLNDVQMKNRRILHDLMVKQGFAPFYGEWWHFSYGDREWAAFYNKKAHYGAIKFES